MIQPMQLLALAQPWFVEQQLSPVLCGASKCDCAPEAQARKRRARK